MNRFLVALILFCCSSLPASADEITLAPASQNQPAGSSASINLSFPGTGGICFPGPFSGPCAETFMLAVISGPDAGQSITTDVSFAFNSGAAISINDTIMNTGGPGTDVLLATGSGTEQMSSNTVDMVWSSSTSAVPEPASLVLLVIGLTAAGFVRRKPQSAELP